METYQTTPAYVMINVFLDCLEDSEIKYIYHGKSGVDRPKYEWERSSTCFLLSFNVNRRYVSIDIKNDKIESFTHNPGSNEILVGKYYFDLCDPKLDPKELASRIIDTVKNG